MTRRLRPAKRQAALDPRPASLTGVPWGLAIDRAGRVLVALADGRILCFDRPA
ncbi:MAG: hypothetical protein ACC628_12630 [Pirellulaceae bacterium]